MLKVTDYVLFISTIVNLVISIVLFKFVLQSPGLPFYIMHAFIGFLIFDFIIIRDDDTEDFNIISIILHIIGVLLALYFSVGGTIKIIRPIIKGIWKINQIP